MMDNYIHIVYGTDDNYIFPTMVSAASALYFAKDKAAIVIHLFDAGVTDAHYEQYRKDLYRISPDVRLERHKLSKEMFVGFGEWKGSVVTYSRMFIAELLPELDWAVYVDGDTLWLGDPAELWKLREENFLVLASKDPPTPMGTPNPEFSWYRNNGLEFNPKDYLCMGLMIANLKLMRQQGIPAKCRRFMEKFPNPRVVDQTVLNYVCRGRMKILPDNWGVFSSWHGGVDLCQPSLIHYCRDVPWCRDKVNKLFSDVVMLWFYFCQGVLNRNEYGKFSVFARSWRRGMFVLLKYNQWFLALHPYLRAKLRNVHGIDKDSYLELRRRLACARKSDA